MVVRKVLRKSTNGLVEYPLKSRFSVLKSQKPSGFTQKHKLNKVWCKIFIWVVILIRVPEEEEEMDQNLRTLNSVNMSLAVQTHQNFVGNINFCPQLPTCDKQSANVSRVEYPSFGKPQTSQTTMNSSIPFEPEPCFQFLRGHCSYGDNCHFTHGVGDTQKLLPHRQRMMARNRNEDRRTVTTMKLCRRFCNGEECPYGDRCHFLHEGPANPWKSSAIRIGTTGRGGLSRNGCEQLERKAPAQLSLSANLVSQRPVFWKTRLCKKWDATGNCPYGVNCYFAHGRAELQKSGSLTAMENGNIFTSKMIPTAATHANTRNGTAYEQQTEGKKCLFKWKGFKKMKLIYADWIDEMPLVHSSLAKVET